MSFQFCSWIPKANIGMCIAPWPSNLHRSFKITTWSFESEGKKVRLDSILYRSKKKFSYSTLPSLCSEVHSDGLMVKKERQRWGDSKRNAKVKTICNYPFREWKERLTVSKLSRKQAPWDQGSSLPFLSLVFAHSWYLTSICRMSNLRQNFSIHFTNGSITNKVSGIN